MSSFFMVTVLLYVGCSWCLEVDNDVFSALLNRLTNLENKVKAQGETNNEQAERIRFLSNQNEGLLARVEAQEQTGNHPENSNAIAAERRFVMDSEGPVAFSAVIAPTVIDHTKPNSPIKFETILTELGNGYNNDTGIFVAPHPGLYLISCSLLDHYSKGGHGGVMIHGEIMRNHDVMARVFAHAETTYRDQGSSTIIAKLAAGDQVWVRTMDNSDLGLGGERYSIFSGYLLWQM